MKKIKFSLTILLFFLVFTGYVFSNNSNNNTNNDNKDIDIVKPQVSNLIKDQPNDRFVENVELQFLDKITGKTSNFETKVGSILKFERLEVLPILCWKSYPEENPENKLLVKIYEIKGKNKKLLFYGWIFSSSPSISGLEHQFYDVVLKNCSNGNKI